MDMVLRIPFYFRFVICSLNGLKNETIIERLVEKTKKRSICKWSVWTDETFERLIHGQPQPTRLFLRGRLSHHPSGSKEFAFDRTHGSTQSLGNILVRFVIPIF